MMKEHLRTSNSMAAPEQTATESNEGSVTVQGRRSNPSLTRLNVVSASNLDNVEIEEVSPVLIRKELNHDSVQDMVL